MIKLIKKKYYRFMSSKNMLKIFYFYHKFFGEKYLGKLEFDFSSKKNRLEIIQSIIILKKFKSYLEIGTYKNEIFSNIICEKKIGVDPVSGGNLRMTSDEFFFQNKENFDLVFIDGLHTYTQVKKDIINSLKILNDGGLILLHDCLPKDYFANAVPRSVINWNGDVWKAYVEMRTKNNLDCYCCYADQGIGVILKRNNSNILRLDNSDFANMKFNFFFQNYKHLMNLKEFDEVIKII